MTEFFDAALAFPAVLFSFALLVVAGYWTVVLLGGLGIDVLDTDADTGAGVDAEGAGFLGAAGFGGVPAAVTLSLVIGLAWFGCRAGSVLVGGVGGTAVHALLSVGVLLVALVGGLAVHAGAGPAAAPGVPGRGGAVPA